MAPTYDELGRKFVGHDKVKIAKVDCTQEINRGLCSQQKVRIYFFLLSFFFHLLFIGLIVFVLLYFFSFAFFSVWANQLNKVISNREKNLFFFLQVNGFPTLFLYKGGEQISEYTGDRSLDDMVTFVTSHLGHDEL